MKIISWNVNGIRSAQKSGLGDFMRSEDADIFLFQEIKISSPDDLSKINPKGYSVFVDLPKKKGYSGLIIYSKKKPLHLVRGIGIEKFDFESRVMTLEFEDFYLVNIYFPHSRRSLERIDFKLEFNKCFQEYMEGLRAENKPIIVGGDFNVAHQEIDLANPKQNKNNAGFTLAERNWFGDFLELGFVDTFRIFNKEPGRYTWWSNFARARERNIGWRIDYFLISENLKSKLVNSYIMPEIFGSDHAPIVLGLNI